MKTTLLITALTSLTATSLFAAESPKVGTAAPDFSLADAKGKTHSVSEYKGKFVVLEWFNPECPFVKKHYSSGNMQKLQEEFAGKGRRLDIDRFHRLRARRRQPRPRSGEQADHRLENELHHLAPRSRRQSRDKPTARKHARTCLSSILKARSFTRARSTAKRAPTSPISPARPTTSKPHSMKRWPANP